MKEKNFYNSSYFLIFTLNLLLFLSGCMVGPNYRQPEPVMPTVFYENRQEETNDIEEDLSCWWNSFNDPFLNELLAETLQGNFDLKIVLEKIYQARATFWTQVAALLPEIDSDAQAIRSRTSQTLTTSRFLRFPAIQNFYQIGLDAIWEIDLFGGLRRAERAAYCTWQSIAEEARNVRIVVLSEVATIYTNICALQQNVDIAQQTIALDQDLLSLATTRFQAGVTNQQEVEGALAILEADRAALLSIETSLKQAVYSLAVLLGRTPESLVEQFAIPRAIPNALGKIPIGLPSDLLRRRPDIRSAERQIASATEQIGVAVADLFPKISLTGSSSSFSSNPLQGSNFGYASNSFNKLFTAPSRIWGLGALISLPIFDFGKRLAVIDEQISLEYQALFNYEKTVIAALQEVESDLVAYFNEEQRLMDLNREETAYRKSLDLTVNLYQAGLASYTQVLQAKETWLTSLISISNSQQALTVNLIALYKALGGGWGCCDML